MSIKYGGPHPPGCTCNTCKSTTAWIAKLSKKEERDRWERIESWAIVIRERDEARALLASYQRGWENQRMDLVSERNAAQARAERYRVALAIGDISSDARHLLDAYEVLLVERDAALADNNRLRAADNDRLRVALTLIAEHTNYPVTVRIARPLLASLPPRDEKGEGT